MLCTLLEGDPPEATTPPCRSASFKTTSDQAALKQEGDGDSANGNNSAQAKTEDSPPRFANEEVREVSTPVVDGGGDGGESRLVNSDHPASDEERRGDEKPEKSRFNVLLGMLTIATMVDAEGEAASSWAAKSSGGIGQDGQETDDGTKSGRNIRIPFLGRISNKGHTNCWLHASSFAY